MKRLNERLNLIEWRVELGSESGHCCFEKSIIEVNSGEIVCELWSDYASLIASAPDMYRELVKVQTQGGLSIGRHKSIDRILAKAKG